jgi:FkbM family methyltransferase
MGISKWQKVKLGIIQHWPLHNKLRIARALLSMKNKDNSPLFKGISFLHHRSIAHTDTSSYIDYSIFATGNYEERIACLIESQLQHGNTVLDIGANVGVHCITMAKAVGNTGRVYAFEPIGYLRERLAQNLWINHLSNVEIVPKALSDVASEEEVHFDVSSTNLGTMSLAKKTAGTGERIQVDVGDTVIAKKQIEEVHLIKIDVEGFELKVLHGLESTIIRCKPRIIFEFDKNYIQRIQENEDVATALFQFFSKKNYLLYEIADHGLCIITDTKAFPASCNVFAIPKFTA